MDFREYEYNDSIFNEEDFKISKIKWIVENKLSQSDRIILLLYCELGSQRKVGKMLGVSGSTINIEMKRIRKKIIELCS